MENFKWEFRGEGDSASPFVLTGVENGIQKFLEDPLDPAAEALASFSDRLDDVSVVVIPPCSNTTITAIYKSIPGLKCVLVLDNLKERLDAWNKHFEGRLPERLDAVLLSKDPDSSLKKLKEKLNNFSSELSLGKCAVYVPRRFKRLFPEFSEFIEKAVLGIQREACSMAAYRTTRAWHVAMNQILNLSFKKVYKIDKDSIVPGQAVVVVGAGPSLDITAPKLRKYQDKAIIVATEAAFPTLIENGVKPDFIATLEDLHLSWRHFPKHMEDAGNTPLILHPGANHTLVRKYPGKVIFMKSNSSPRWFGGAYEHLEQCDFGLCVGHFAFHIAEKFNPEMIVLTGFDLAFREGKFHPSSMATPYMKDRPDSFTYIEVDAVNGGKVKTDISMSFYIKYFETKIAESHYPVIDATEGGALIKGALIKNLDDIFENKNTVKKPEISINYEHNSFNEESFTERLRMDLEALENGLESAFQAAVSHPSVLNKNPFSGTKTDTPSFELLSSCCSALLISKFSGIAADKKALGTKEYYIAATALMDEFREGFNFFRNLFKIRKYHVQNLGKLIALVPDAHFKGDYLKSLGISDAVEISEDTPLPVLWEKIIAENAGTIVCFDGKVIPDMWSVPDIKCVDIKTKFERNGYERSLWIPGYEVICTDRDVFDEWNAYIPEDVKMTLKEG